MHYAPGLILLMCSFLQSSNALPWRAVHGEIFAFLAVLMWGWGVRCRNAVPVRLNMPVIAFLGMGLLVAIQYATGQIVLRGDAAVLLLYALLCIGALLVAQLHGEDVAWPTALASALLLAALASALVALIQALGVWTESDWILRPPRFRRPGANFGQANHLGTLLVMGAASLIYLDQRFGISRPVILLLSLLLLVGMGISESRTGLLSGLILCFWWFARRQVFIRALRWPWVVIGVLALLTSMWVWPTLITHIQEAGPLPEGGGGTINTTAGVRVEVWQQLWEAVWIKPWLGWGLLGVPTAHNAVLHSYSNSLPFSYAHNVILDMAIGMGLPLTVFALCALGVWGGRRVRSVQTVASWYAVGLLIPFAIHSLLEYPFAYAYLLVPALLAIGMLEQNYALPAGKKISRKVLVGGLIIFGSLLAWVGVEYLEIEEDFRVARFESLNVGQTPVGYERPNIVLLTQLRAMVAATRTTPRPHMSHEEIDLLRTATLRFPWVAVQNCYALSLALNGSPQEAVRQLKVMRAMHGEKAYEGIKAKWTELANTTYPQLKALEI
ncbi:PglL family O-oligosaccharyltransferase [Polaromonas sp. SM01]|uniref:PglL family O-oligosaccharyltransferase n=1 Tax=Polaromonas sp. SM01 TaxID=3085630 RepID=UPI0029810E33|nr:Wzy polymerase domain-containing protein [Polaromonas sp. SM01]MDW5441077.1 Wzy polymerase domain-containing protein [Polaromonas sp. SM01]